MLTAATVLTSLGTDSANVRHAPTERANSADACFAKCFDESSAVAVGVPPRTDDQKPEDLVDCESSVPGNNAGNSRRATAAVADIQMKQDANAGDEMKKEPTTAKSGSALPSQKGTAPTTVGVTIPSMGAAAQHGERSGNLLPLIPMDTSEVSIPSEDVQYLDQKNVSSVVDDTKMDATKMIADPQADGTDLQGAGISGEQAAPVIQNLKETPPLEEAPGKILTKRDANAHGDAVKTEKTSRTEKGKAVQAVDRAAAVEVPSVATAPPVSIPTIVLSIDRQQHGLKADAEDGAVSSATSSAPTGGVGTTAVKPGGRDTKPEDIKKTDDGNVKTQGPVLTDNSASRKTGADESKTALAPIKATDGETATTRSIAQPLTVSVAAHGELRVAGVPGGGIAHVIATSSAQTAEASTHAATGQPGSGLIDSAASTDATHKTLMATPTSLEIGVVNGTHGWLKIRADMTTGGVVNASLSTSTSSGQEMLHRELPSLTAYLQSERVTVNAVVIQPPTALGADLRGFDGAMNGDGRGQAQQSGSQGGESRQGAADSAPNRVDKDGFYSGPSGGGGDELLSLASLARGGNWLNVRA